MNDTQGQSDIREVDLQRVGVKNVDLPFHIQEQGGGIQTVLAKVQLSVDLPRQYKGTHMSRFIEILETWKDQPSSSGQLEHILADTRTRLNAQRSHCQVQFKYFLTKRAPVSRRTSTMGYDCSFDATLDDAGSYDLVMGVVVPITTVCPCSKEISIAGAHNQRAWLQVNVRTVPGHFLWLEELITQLETFGSCEIYPLLKRPDEKYVTEEGYFHPKFVEDVLRDVVLWLRSHPLVTWFEVECEADESIHLHNAFAYQQEPLPITTPRFLRHDTTNGVLPLPNPNDVLPNPRTDGVLPLPNPPPLGEGGAPRRAVTPPPSGGRLGGGHPNGHQSGITPKPLHPSPDDLPDVASRPPCA